MCMTVLPACVYIHWMRACGGQRRALSTGTKLDVLVSCHMGALQEQSVLLTPVPSLQHMSLGLKKMY